MRYNMYIYIFVCICEMVYVYVHVHVCVAEKCKMYSAFPSVISWPRVFPGLVGLLQTFEDSHVDLHGVGGFKGRFA